jgi:3-hydroxyacyl-CoA dehydrogenase
MTQDIASPVSYECSDEIALIRINNPPVNALSHAVRLGLDDAFAHFASDDTAKIAVILCEGRTFIAGADIKEFGKPIQKPNFPDLVNRIEAQNKPVVALLHGTALGGGLEVALATHYRIAMPGAKMGLPEVHLGILPGAGGTQRLPRIVGAEKALDMITSGRHVGAAEALETGLVDEIGTDDDIAATGINFARKLLAEGKGVRRTSDMPLPEVSDALFDDWRKKLARKSRGQLSPLHCIEAVRAGCTLPITQGLARERELFTELMESPQRLGLIHAFFIERQVSKLPELKGVTPHATDNIGIIGGGTMGAGIATACLLSGIKITLIERDDAAVAKARETITGYLAAAVKRGKLAADKQGAILDTALTCTTDYAALSDADMVIEAVFEDIEVKKEVFRELDAVCRQGAVLATNTSYLDINEIAAVTGRPEDVIGLHFFSPAHIMKLLEVVVADKTAPDVLATGFALAKRLHKVAVRAGVCDGFIGNRILATYRKATDHLVLDGASPYQIDKALTDFGLAMGPFAVADLAGLDIGWATRKRKAASLDPRDRVAGFADRICEKGRFGQKTGRGYYIYEDGARVGKPDPEVLEIIAAERAERGITPREFTDAEITRRYMAAMINEGAKVVQDGIARRPLDVDMTLIAGYGFPRYQGGPMKYADIQGLDRILADLDEFAREDAWFWEPAQLIRDLVARGDNFDILNK